MTAARVGTGWHGLARCARSARAGGVLRGSPSLPGPGPTPGPPPLAPLTGIVWLPCRALIAACASAWEEYFTKAHPGGTGEAEPLAPGPPGRPEKHYRAETQGTGGAEGRGRIPDESRMGDPQRLRKRDTEKQRHRKTWTGGRIKRPLKSPCPCLDSASGLPLSPGRMAWPLPSMLPWLPVAGRGQLEAAQDPAVSEVPSRGLTRPLRRPAPTNPCCCHPAHAG